MKILIIDIETTGLNPKTDKIVEVGIVELDLNNGKKQIVFDSLVYDPPVGNIEKSWIVANGYIKAEEIMAAPFFLDKKPKIQEIINNYEHGATAYNNVFDFGFLEHSGIIFRKKLPCPMLLSTNICQLPGPYGYKWPNVEEAWNYFFPEIEYIEKHRGADDAFHEADIVYELFKRKIFKL